VLQNGQLPSWLAQSRQCDLQKEALTDQIEQRCLNVANKKREESEHEVLSRSRRKSKHLMDCAYNSMSFASQGVKLFNNTQ
jgi:hypothetical protein